MIIFPAQLHRFHISVTGDRVISLTSYPQYASEISKVTDQGMGKEFIIIMIPSENTQEIDEFRNESPEETKERFRKRMNVLIAEYSEKKGGAPDKVREDLKAEWIKTGLIKKSTTELDVAGYAKIITQLLEKLNEN